MPVSHKTAGRPTLGGRLARLLRKARAESGATLVEFGMVLPMLLALVFGVMEGGRIVFTQAVISHATQSASRWAIVNPPAAGQTPQDYELQIETYAKSNLILISPNQVSTAAATSPTDPSDNTRTITITLSYDFQWLMPFISDATGPIQLSASASGFIAENF